MEAKNKTVKVLAIIGSPQDKRSNTTGFVKDFLDDIEAEGVTMDRRIISLGTEKVHPCKGCWNCTREKPCPLAGDDLESIKMAMLDCDLLILGSPVYTNQVSAQMKAFFDRLFTWCHIFPLSGKMGLSVVTTGNDGYRETGEFLEKMLATYGVRSFGTIVATRAFTPGFFPSRQRERQKNLPLARKIATALRKGKMPPVTAWNRKMFGVMKKKMTGIHLGRYLSHGSEGGLQDPPRALITMAAKGMKKKGITPEQVDQFAGLMTFEFQWWKDRHWLGTKRFSQLQREPVPKDFDLYTRLLK